MISRSFTDQRWSYIYIQARDGFKPIYRIQIISHASIDSSTNQIRSYNHLQSRQSFTLIYWRVMKSNPSADQRCFHIYLQLRDGITFITDELRCSCTHYCLIRQTSHLSTGYWWFYTHLQARGPHSHLHTTDSIVHTNSLEITSHSSTRYEQLYDHLQPRLSYPRLRAYDRLMLIFKVEVVSHSSTGQSGIKLINKLAWSRIHCLAKNVLQLISMLVSHSSSIK